MKTKNLIEGRPKTLKQQLLSPPDVPEPSGKDFEAALVALLGKRQTPHYKKRASDPSFQFMAQELGHRLRDVVDRGRLDWERKQREANKPTSDEAYREHQGTQEFLRHLRASKEAQKAGRPIPPSPATLRLRKKGIILDEPAPEEPL
jgi:hypothetical protein